MAVVEFLQTIGAQWQTILIASAILLVVYVLWGVIGCQSGSTRYGDVPGPRPLPLLGNTIDLLRHKGQIYLLIDEYYKKYGKVFTMRSFGPHPNLVVGDPEMLKDIFVKEFDSFSDRPNLLKLPEPFTSMMTTAEKEKWKRIRNTLTPAFSALKMKQMIPLMNSCCDKLTRKLGEIADKQQSVNIVKLQQALTMDAIVSAAFGLEANSQDNPDDPVIAIARNALDRTSVLNRMLVGLLMVVPFGIKILEAFPSLCISNMTPLFEMTKNIVATKRAGSENSSRRKDLLDMMLAAADDPAVPDSKKLSDSEVIAQSLTFLIAGHETSSATLSLTCYHLATHPEIQDKVQQEIDSLWSDEEQMPAYDTVNELTYLDMVISETLRLYPPGFIISRLCIESCILKGIKIPKDSVILIPVYSVQRDPAIYPDPEKFDPERFSAEAKQSRNSYAYMPFGHGPHNCIGLRFAQLEMKLVLARILKKYRLEVGPDTKIPPEVGNRGLLSCSEINLRITSRIKET